MKIRIIGILFSSLTAFICGGSTPGQAAEKPQSSGPIKVIILAGDENVLEQGRIEGRTDGVHEDFFPNATPTKGELKKHVHATVYKGAYSPDSDYDQLKPVATDLVEIGDQFQCRVGPCRQAHQPESAHLDQPGDRRRRRQPQLLGSICAFVARMHADTVIGN